MSFTSLDTCMTSSSGTFAYSFRVDEISDVKHDHPDPLWIDMHVPEVELMIPLPSPSVSMACKSPLLQIADHDAVATSVQPAACKPRFLVILDLVDRTA